MPFNHPGTAIYKFRFFKGVDTTKELHYYPFTNNNSNTKSMDSSITQILQSPPPFPLLLTSLLFLFVLVRFLKKSEGQSKVPPGPKPLPIIGNLHQLTNGLPHHVLTRLSKKYGAVIKLQLGQIVVVVISSSEAAKQVLKTHEISFSQRPRFNAVEIMPYGDHSSIIFAPYDEFWRQARKIAMIELFSTKRVLSFRSIREEEVWSLVEFISSSEGQTINVSDKIFSMINDTVSRSVFGNKCKDQKDFLIALEEVMSTIAGAFDITDLYPSLKFLLSITSKKSKLLVLYKKVDKILEDLLTRNIKKRNVDANGNDQESIVDILLNHAEAGNTEFHMKVDQIKGILLDLFSAGTETSATTIEWAMAELLKNPKVMKKAQEEVRQACKQKGKIKEADIQNLEYLKLVIKETFRLHPPATLIPRLAFKSCEIDGYTIPANTNILINPYAIGRDPIIWTNPECFQPERFEGSSIDFKGNDFELIPFGSGRRICPGLSFAIASIELALSQLLYHFDWKLANGIKLEDLDMIENFALSTRKKNNLNVIATARFPFQK